VNLSKWQKYKISQRIVVDFILITSKIIKLYNKNKGAMGPKALT
jgi:hypothetical protein